MSLVHWEPLKELNTLRQQMNRLFDDMIHTEPANSIFSKLGDIAWNPAIELKEVDRDIILKIQVPGVDPKDLDIQVSDRSVAIAGEYAEEKTSDSEGYYHSEFSYGKLQRVIPLPVSVKPNQVTADTKDGIVTLTLPKVEIPDAAPVKVNLTIQEKAREAMAKERLHEENLQANMQERATEELSQSHTSQVAESARNAMTQERQHQEHVEETMHARAAAEVGAEKVEK